MEALEKRLIPLPGVLSYPFSRRIHEILRALLLFFNKFTSCFLIEITVKKTLLCLFTNFIRYKTIVNSQPVFVFGAGTVGWAHGLDATHGILCNYVVSRHRSVVGVRCWCLLVADRLLNFLDTNSGAPADRAIQQATINLFADMSIQPSGVPTGLTITSASTDTTAPTVTLPDLSNSVTLPYTFCFNVSDDVGVVANAEIQFGTSWKLASRVYAPVDDNLQTFCYVLGRTTAPSISGNIQVVDDSGNISPSIPFTVIVNTASSSSCGEDSLGGTAHCTRQPKKTMIMNSEWNFQLRKRNLQPILK